MQKGQLGKSNFRGSGLGLAWTHQILLLAALFALSVAAQAQTDKKAGGAPTEWLSYGGDKASSKYSPVAQINSDNFNRLTVVWTWRSAEEVNAL